MWRSFKFRVAVWILGSLLTLLAILVAALHTPPVRRYALKQAIEILGNQGVTFDASSIDYNLLSLRATLRDVTVRSPQAPDLPALAHADLVRVDLSLRKLIRGAYHIEDAEIRNPAIHVVIDENGRDNIPKPPRKEDTGETDYLIDEFLVSGGSLRFEDRRQQIAASLPLWRVTVDGNPVTKDHEIRLESREPGIVSFQQRSLPVRGLTADVLLKDDALEIRSLKLGTGESTIAVSGKLDNFDDPRYDIKADTDLALGSMVRFAGVKQNVSGTVHVALTANGPLAQMRATARIDGQDLTVERFDRLDLKAETTYDAGAQRVILDSFNVSSPAGAVHGKGSLALNTNAGQSTLNAAVRGLDLFRVSNTLDLPVRIASRATGDIAASWPGLAFEQAAGDARVRLAAIRQTPAKDVLTVSGALNVQTKGQRIVVGIPSVQTLDTHASGQITLTNRRTLGGRVSLEVGDLSDTVAEAEAFLGRKPGTLVGTNLDGPLTAEARLDGTIENPAVSATIKSADLQAGTLTGITLDAAIDYTRTGLLIRKANVEWQDQRIAASGTVGLTGRVPALDVQASTSNLSIPTLLAATGRKDIPADGTVTLNATIHGTTEDPRGQVSISGADLRAYNEVLGSLTAQADIANQLVTVNQFRLTKPQTEGDGILRATGTYHLDTRNYTLDLDSSNIRLTSLTLPDGSAVRARIDLAAEGQGSVDNPSLTLKAEAADVQYQERRLGDVNLTADVRNQQATLAAEAPQFNLSAKATLGLKDPNPTTFEVTANNTSLQSLPFKLDQPLEGNITATIRGSGDLDRYEQGRATVEVAQAKLTYNNQPIRTEGPLIAHYDNQTLTVERATIQARNSRISVNGRLPLETTAGAGTIIIKGTLDLATLIAYLPGQEPVTASGTATIDGTIAGTLKRIDPALTIAVDNGYLLTPALNPPLSNVTIRAEVRDGALDLRKASADWGVASISATGEIPFALLPANLPVELPRRSGPARFTAELSRLDLATIHGLPETLAGSLSIRLDAEAPRPELEAVTGKVTFPVLKVSLGSYALEQKGASTIALANGIARIESFQLTGPATDLRLTGTAGLTGTRPLDLRADGNVDASIAGAFTDAVRARGATEIQLAVTGTLESPQAQGFIQLADAQVSVEEPRIAAEDLSARVDLAGNRISLSRLSGNLNGGTLSGGGSMTFAKGQVRDANFKINAEGMYLDYPEGLKTVSNVALNLSSTPENLIVGGDIAILEGGLTEDLSITSNILDVFSSPRGLELTEDRNPAVERIRFNLGVRTVNPIVVDNNHAEAEITADLRLLGNPYQPGISGRVVIEEGGLLRLNEREYTVERGVITFTNERRIEPGLDILATTSAAGYDIRLQITGEPGKTETTLTSDPPLPEPDILAVLLTGKKLEDVRGHEFEVAQNQVLSYLTGRVGSQLGRGIAQATGLSMVRIEPTLIADETDPGARLTVGQDITRNLDLVYSMDLTNSSDQIYVAEYDISRRFSTRGVRQSDGSFRMDFRHDVRFGGLPEPRRGERRERRTISNVSILGEPYFPEKEIRDKLGVEAGDRYDFFDIRKGVDRVRRMYAKANLLESAVRLSREAANGSVGLKLTVERGPMVDFVFEGVSIDGDARDRVREIWQGGVFDAQRLDDSIQAIQTWLIKEHHLQAKIDTAITTPQPGRKRVLFDIHPGSEFHGVEIAFEGASGIEPKTLREIIDDQKLSTDVYVKPRNVTQLLEGFYREQGYFDASIEAPRYELNSRTRTGRVVFPVQEGPLYRIASVNFEGNTVYDDARLAEAVPLPKGEAYRPVLRERAIQKVQELYWEKGYNDMETEVATSRSKENGTVGVTIKIAENRQSIVREVAITGNQNTSDNLIRTQLELSPGDILNLQLVSNSRRNLYNTGAFTVVEITRDEIAGNEADRTRAQGVDVRTSLKPMRLTVNVREVQPFQIRYGGFYDTERGPGAIVDVTNYNSLGSARVLGLRSRYDAQLQEARLYFSQPLLRRFPITTIASPYVRREQNPATEDADPFNVDRIGFSVQQEAKFFRKYVLNYGYRIERSRTYDPGPDPFFDIPLRIAAVTSTLTRETRDDILDATRGQFISSAFEWSPEVLGSQLRFIKYFGQYFRYIPLQKPKVELFTNEVLRPRLVYAAGVRVGLAKGLGGQEVPLAERFFAGGSTTIRGFEQNSVGPRAGSQQLGGEAMLVINNELRFPLFGWVDGVGFLDVGNVYPNVSDIGFTDIRKAAGPGIRVRTPWFLLRLDYGVKLDRRPGESLGRLFFSIGQAF